MKSPLGKIALFATSACLLTPLVSFAQNIASQPGRVNRSLQNLTLLTGPTMLSAPTRPLAVSSVSSEVVAPGGPTRKLSRAEIEDRLKLLQAQATQARTERDAALQRAREMEEMNKTSPLETIRFDTRLPETPSPLLRPAPQPASPPPELKRD